LLSSPLPRSLFAGSLYHQTLSLTPLHVFRCWYHRLWSKVDLGFSLLFD
jgi:heme A synthase